MKRNVTMARRLRQDQTNAERTLWFRLRDRRLEGLKFRRQVPVNRYVVDFLCGDAKIIIEIDGGQHADRSEHDVARTRALEAAGYLVLRFWNNEVLSNIGGVLESIINTLKQHSSDSPHPDPLPTGEREKNT